MMKLRFHIGVAVSVCALFLLPIPVAAAITHLQSNLAASESYTSHQSVALTNEVKTGDLIVVAISSYAGINPDITSVTDSKGNIYTRAVRNPEIPSGQHHISIWYAKNVAGGSITVTASAPSNEYITIAAHEYSGASTDSVLDRIGGNNGSSVLATIQNTEGTTQNNELLFGAFMHDTATNPEVTAAAGYSVRQSLTDGNFEPLITEDSTLTTAGSIAAGITWSSALPWRGVLATFRAGESATTTPTATTIPSVQPTPKPLITGPESFEDAPSTWHVNQNSIGTGSVQQSGLPFSGNSAAQLTTADATSSASLQKTFSDPASAHQWQEHSGTYIWQHLKVYIPSATINQLSGSEYLTLGGMWASAGGHGWFLRVNEGGQLTVVGTKDDGTPITFSAYGSLPTDQWVDLELGLNTQNGPGIKRAFSFLINGHFYGWYRQGRMDAETYDRVGAGILDTNSADTLTLYIDDWNAITNAANPSGPDLRPVGALQEHSFLDGSGENVQLDWSTWQNDIRLSTSVGLYSNTDRVQASISNDKMPELSSGWGEIEIGWSGNTPPINPNSYFGPMLSFHKDMNREEDLEVIPIGKGDGTVDLALEAWTNGAPTVLARWPLPEASFGQGSHIPEPGDIIRARWHQTDASSLAIQASFFDASTNTWNNDIINGTYNVANLPENVNLNDGFHTKTAMSIDTTFYSILRYQVGTLDTYPASMTATPSVLPPSPTQTPTPTMTPSPTPTTSLTPTASKTVTISISAAEDFVNQDGSIITKNGTNGWIGNAASASASYTGLRFNNIQLPRNSTITSATLRVFSSQSQWLPISFAIAAEATANSGPFDDINTPASKSLTNSVVSQTSNENWAAATWYTVGNVKPLVQEVINREDWQSGNSISFILKGTGSNSWERKFIQGFTAGTNTAPQLVLTYE